MNAFWRPPSRGRISVVVPLYNHARYIAEAIGSALAQGPLVREVVVIDDGSVDGSAAVVAELARDDPRIRLQVQANQGAHVAINVGLRRAAGEYVAILNSDDAWLPGRLEALAAALAADPGADVAASGLAFMDAEGSEIGNAWYDAALSFRDSCGELGVALVNANFLMTTSNLLIRRSALSAVGGFAPLRYTHDLDFLLRTLALGRRVAVVDAVLMRYRIHPGNTIAEEHGRVRAEWAVAAAGYLTALWDRPGAPPIAWDAACAMEDVLQRHELARAVHLCMAEFRRQGAATLDRLPLLQAPAFLERVRAWV